MRTLLSLTPQAARPAAPPARQHAPHSTPRGQRLPPPPHRPTLHPPRGAAPPLRPPRAVAAAATSPSDTPTVPASREAAVAAAAAAIAAVLGDGQPSPAKPRAEPSRGKKKAKPKAAAPKGFATANAARCVVELPLAEDTPATAAALAADLLAELPGSLASTAVVAFGDVDAALAASDRVNQPVTVCGGDDDDNTSALPPGAWLLLVSPPTDDRAVRATLATAKGHVVVCVNAPVDVLAAPPPSYGRGWAPAYVFQPIAIQGGLSSLLGASSSGAVLCVARGAGPSTPLWLIVDANNNLIGRSQRRPSPRDLEDAFYNAAAASSPLTKGAAALKGITDTLRGKK